MNPVYESKKRYAFRHTSQLDFLPHLHDAVELVYLERGEADFLDGDTWVHLTAGDIFVSFPNRVHGYENSRELSLYLLILPTGPCLPAFRQLLTEQAPVQAWLKQGRWEHTGVDRLLAMAWHDRETASAEVMLGYFQVIIGKLLPLLSLQPADSGADCAMQTVLSYIGSHYRQPVTRKELARAVGYSESYISHLFSRTLKTSLPEYIHALRLQDAVELLTRTQLSVSRIAMDLGFGSLRSFNRAFLRQTGQTPRQYRNSR